jgi:hypothetical protein
MSDTDFPQEVPGAVELFAWFGGWPSFHDGEVLSLFLNRAGTSFLRIHTSRMTRSLDSNGNYVLEKHCVVTFSFEEIAGVDIGGFNAQNVIFGLTLNKVESGYKLQLDPCYGLAGFLVGTGLGISFEPGLPSQIRGTSV